MKKIYLTIKSSNETWISDIWRLSTHFNWSFNNFESWKWDTWIHKSLYTKSAHASWNLTGVQQPLNSLYDVSRWVGSIKLDHLWQ